MTPAGPVRWERCVYNAAAVRLQGRIYVLYRALGEDGVSRLGLWWSRDGLTEEGRSREPIFGPEQPWEMPTDPEGRRARQMEEHRETREVGGTEDPRLIPVGDKLYMTYTAYGDIPRLAVARIPVEDFVDGLAAGDGANLRWERLGVVHEGWNDKDGYVLPELVQGRWVLYHRIPPDIQVTSFEKWRLPLETPGLTLLTPRPGQWDSVKVGGGAPPLRTEFGWLHLYHGVSGSLGQEVYSLGIFVTPLDDPFRVTYRSAAPILEPEEPCELEGWVDRVVFTCGAVPEGKDSNETLSRDDGVIVYYGGADEVMCAARSRIGDLIDDTQ